MKSKVLLVFIITISLWPLPLFSRLERGQPTQQIQIIMREILVLEMLIANMRRRQEITAPTYLTVNLRTNSVLLEKNVNQPHPIASITKLMTALLTKEKIDQDRTIVLTAEMLKPLGQSPVLFAGLEISAEKLLKANLIQSTNDASLALAHFLGPAKFVDLMNERAKEIGMKETIFVDPHGLSLKNRSTVQDLLKLLSYIYTNHPEILTITKNNDFWLPDRNGKLLKFQNMNHFYPLPNFIGGKSGFLPNARQSMAAIFEINNNPIAILVLRSNNRQADIFAILRKINKLNY